MGLGRKMHILVADDLRRNQNALVDPLRRRGHSVERAATGREALHMVFVEDFDLLILDVHMPVMDGFQAAREIRSRESHLTHQLGILGVVSALRPEDARRALAAGMDAVVTKPLSTRALIREIERIEEKLAEARAPEPELPEYSAPAPAPRRPDPAPFVPPQAEPPKVESPAAVEVEEDPDEDIGLEDTQALEVPQADVDDTQLLDVPEQEADPATIPAPAPPEVVPEPSTVSVGDLEAVWQDVVSAAPLKQQEPQAIDILLQGDLPRAAPKKGFTIIRSDKTQEDFRPE